MDDEHRAGTSRRQHPVVTEQDGVGRVGVVEAETDHVAAGADLGRRRRRLRIGPSVAVEHLGAPGPQHRRQAGGDHHLGHRRALVTQADEPVDGRGPVGRTGNGHARPLLVAAPGPRSGAHHLERPLHRALEGPVAVDHGGHDHPGEKGAEQDVEDVVGIGTGIDRARCRRPEDVEELRSGRDRQPLVRGA